MAKMRYSVMLGLLVVYWSVLAFCPVYADDRLLEVVVDEDFPPFSFRDGQGGMQGLLIDNWRLWSQKAGVPVRFKGMARAALLQPPGEGESVVIEALLRNGQRDPRFLCLLTPRESSVAVFSHRSIEMRSTPEELSGLVVGVKAGDEADRLLQGNGSFRLLEFGSYDEMFKAAVERRIIAFAVDKPVAMYYLHQYGLEGVFQNGVDLSAGHFQYLAAANNPELMDEVERGFRQINALEYDEIFRKWFPAGIRNSNVFDVRAVKAQYANPDMVNTIFILLIFVGLILLTWNFALNQSVRKKTAELAYAGFHDSLTGLYNRYYFEQCFKRLQQSGGAVGIMVADVDGLKMVNDTYGHEQGDELLKRAAKVIKQCFAEKQAVVARIGGDEFVVLLEEADEEEFREVCSCIQWRIEQENDRETVSDIPLHISLGYAISSMDGVPPGDLFRLADHRMYRNKLHRRRSARGNMLQTLQRMLAERDYVSEDDGGRLRRLMEKMARAVNVKEMKLPDLLLFAQFHDIGKVGVSDAVFNKPEPLTFAERQEMQRHTEIGCSIAKSSQELIPIADWILKHHERWDGAGYPLGLAGEEIPLACRIWAIVDSYDAMLSERPYRPAMTHEEAMAQIRGGAGSQYDPALAEVFIGIMEEEREE